MNVRKKSYIGTGIIAVILLAVFFVSNIQGTSQVGASNSDNVYGEAWGANSESVEAGIGWVSMNNCESPNGPCPGVGYGVSIDTITGDFSGAAWSSNYGWVNFDPGSNVCQGSAASVDLQDVIDNGEADVEGFIHVYNAPSDGFWDGCIKLSGSWNDGVTLYLDGDIDGVAWGDQVVGWLDFTDVTTGLVFGCTDSTADNYNSDANVDDNSCPVNPDYCPSIDIGDPGPETEAEAWLLGYSLLDGKCVEDHCPNIDFLNDGIEPDDEALYDDYNDNNSPGYEIDNNGWCVPEPVIDLCPEPGIQLVLPCSTLPPDVIIPEFEEV